VSTQGKSVDLDPAASAFLAAYIEAKIKIKEWQEKADIAAEQVKAALGDCEIGLVNGREAIKWTFVESRSLDITKARNLLPAELVEQLETGKSFTPIHTSLFIGNRRMTFNAPGNDALALADHIRGIIQNRSANAPRSKQKKIGLSEVGEPCVRRLSYKLMDWTITNKNTDPWASISGTAIHAWLAETFQAEGKRYLVEHPVKVTEELSGTCDLFDKQEGMVIDHKCVGSTSMKARKSGGMTDQQRIQINLYGLGMENLGHKVKKVALAFYPLGGRLDGLYTIVEDYSKATAMAAIERLDNSRTLLWQLDPENNPNHWELIPATKSRSCLYCPFFLPGSTNLSRGCPGTSDAQ
jgi:hypothetical protein